MSVMSSESVFHFTKSLTNLIGILKNEFYPRFCIEVCELGDRMIKGAFPMVCFCDIPLSQVKDHIGKYGPYGLGMAKNWAEKMGLNPVLYVKKNSHLSNHIQGFVDIKFSQHEATDESSNIEQALTSILRYIKAFEGVHLRGCRVPRMKFYDERELRYVPPPEITKNRFLFLSERQYWDSKTLRKYNSMISHIKLSFDPDDIRYIIIKDENEVSGMVRALKEIKQKYSDETVERLITRILTSDQIMKDF